METATSTEVVALRTAVLVWVVWVIRVPISIYLFLFIRPFSVLGSFGTHTSHTFVVPGRHPALPVHGNVQGFVLPRHASRLDDWRVMEGRSGSVFD